MAQHGSRSGLDRRAGVVGAQQPRLDFKATFVSGRFLYVSRSSCDIASKLQSFVRRLFEIQSHPEKRQSATWRLPDVSTRGACPRRRALFEQGEGGSHDAGGSVRAEARRSGLSPSPRTKNGGGSETRSVVQVAFATGAGPNSFASGLARTGGSGNRCRKAWGNCQHSVHPHPPVKTTADRGSWCGMSNVRLCAKTSHDPGHMLGRLGSVALAFALCLSLIVPAHRRSAQGPELAWDLDRHGGHCLGYSGTAGRRGRLRSSPDRLVHLAGHCHASHQTV